MKYMVIILCLFIVLHLKYNTKTTNHYTILQVDNTITKSQLEEYFQKKLPLVITNLGNRWKEFMKLSPQYIKKYCSSYPIKLHKTIKEQQKTNIVCSTMKKYTTLLLQSSSNDILNPLSCQQTRLGYISEDKQFLKDYGLLHSLHHHTRILFPPMAFIKTYMFSMGPSGTKIGLRYETNFRNILYLVYGKIKIRLIHPKYNTYLYPSKRYDNNATLSSVNFWKINDLQHPLFKKVQYIEIVMSPGQLLFIPSYWWYAVEYIETSITISIKTNNVFSSIQKIPEVITSLYHLGGKYKVNNCTCHTSIR